MTRRLGILVCAALVAVSLSGCLPLLPFLPVAQPEKPTDDTSIPAWYRVGTNGELAFSPCESIVFAAVVTTFGTLSEPLGTNRIQGPNTFLEPGDVFVITPLPEGWARNPSDNLPVDWDRIRVSLGRSGDSLTMVDRTDLEPGEWGLSGEELLGDTECPSPEGRQPARG
jgi:hypothetical protein